MTPQLITFQIETPEQTAAQAYNDMISQGWDPRTAAQIIDAGFMSYEDWLDHYTHYGDNRSSDYHEQMVRY